MRFALLLDKRHVSAKGYPVCVRVTYDYRQRYFRHGDVVSDDEFAKVCKTTKGAMYEKRKEWEAHFDRIFKDAAAKIDGGEFSINSYSPWSWSESAPTINALLRERITSLAADGKVNTAELYGTVLKRIVGEFGEVSVSDVGVEFVKRFAKSISGLSKATQSIYLRNLRAICNYAIYKGEMKRSQYPFSTNRYDSGRLRIPNGGSRNDRFLSVEDMRKLYAYSGDKYKEVGLFLFSYLANGANLADIARLRFDSHYYKSVKKELGFIRQKTRDTSTTETVIYIPVTEWISKLMRRLGVVEERGALLFPGILDGCGGVKSESMRLDGWSKRIGKAVQSVCSELGIEGCVTMTWARHSFKTNLIRQKVPDWYCEQAMGHVDRSVGAHYVGMFTTEDRIRYNSMLL